MGVKLEKLGYSVEEAAEALGVGRTAVYERIGTGEIESVKIGARRVIPGDALQRYMARLIAEQGQDARRGA